MRAASFQVMPLLAVTISVTGAAFAQGPANVERHPLSYSAWTEPSPQQQPQRLPQAQFEVPNDVQYHRVAQQNPSEPNPQHSPHEELPPGPTYPSAPYSQSPYAYPVPSPAQQFANAAAQQFPKRTPGMPAPNAWHYGAYNDGLGPQVRVFEPKARVYFDVGEERDGKLDIFHDGSLAPSINFLELYWAQPFPEGVGHHDWRWGPCLGVGISSPAGSNGAAEATGAPVLLSSIGLQFEFTLSQQMLDRMREEGYTPAQVNEAWQESAKVGIEFGFAGGVSSDETLDFKGDGAIYVGVTLHRGN
jgi:hypothetical protein